MCNLHSRFVRYIKPPRVHEDQKNLLRHLATSVSYLRDNLLTASIDTHTDTDTHYMMLSSDVQSRETKALFVNLIGQRLRHKSCTIKDSTWDLTWQDTKVSCVAVCVC